MTNAVLEDIGQFRDIPLARSYPSMTEVLGMPPAEALAVVNWIGRDKCRSPMQWADAPNGGFSPAGVQPWLPVNPNYAQGVNVAEQMDDPNSLLNFYRRMLRLRKGTPALTAGDYTPLHEEAEDYVAFLRRSPLSSPLLGGTEGGEGQALRQDSGQGTYFI